MTSWITFSWSGEKVFTPIRLAGTCRQYSKKAIHQLTRITFHNATSRNFRCPYHAKVIKMFEPISSKIVHIDDASPHNQLEIKKIRCKEHAYRNDRRQPRTPARTDHRSLPSIQPLQQRCCAHGRQQGP